MSYRILTPNRATAFLLLCTVVVGGCKTSSSEPAPNFKIREISAFGTNPGGLKMFQYVPSSLRQKPALVVALHGCTQDAHDYANHSGWPELANRIGFVVLFPQQSLANNPAKCFNWFEPKNNRRGLGEALSIEQMVEKAKAVHDVDNKRIFVTGLSAGGAMTSVMLAAYPDVFSGGAIMSGVAYGCATKRTEAVVCMRSRVSRTPEEWGDLVRSASQTQSWPVVSIWHGMADKIIDPINADEEAEQWTNVQGIPLKASTSDTVHGYPHRTFFRDGKPVVEVFSIINMRHGQAVDPGTSAEQCGTTEMFFPKAQICAAYYASKFWGLLH